MLYSLKYYMKPITIISAPSVYGLKPTGVEHAPAALRSAGLLERLSAEDGGIVYPSSPYNAVRDPDTLMLNTSAVRSYSNDLAIPIASALEKNKFPLVLGGDCSIVLGALHALREQNAIGLLYIDGHADFYHAEASPTGEVADMVLQVASGRSPELFPETSREHPLIPEQRTVLFGYRDAAQARADGSADVRETAMDVYALTSLREQGILESAEKALRFLDTNGAKGYWIHFDVDVLEDSLMPAVDYRLPDGLLFEEASEALRTFLHKGNALGMDITIFNPALDPEKKYASSLVDLLERAFKP